MISSEERPIVVNARFTVQRQTGAQRYAHELTRRLGDSAALAVPPASLKGSVGHAWEQFVLPLHVGRRQLLWSPTNTGPLAVRRQVVTLHDVVPLDHPEWLNPRFAAWYRWLTPRLARRCECVLTVSEFSRMRIVERCGVPAERVVVVPNGVVLPATRPDAEAIDAARHLLRIPFERYVLVLGSIEPRKNVGRVLQAWSRIHASLDDDIGLVIAGAQGRRAVFRASAESAEVARTHYTGYVPDEHLGALYAGATMVAYPSEYEGFGIPPLEAMAFGAPVLTSNNTALPEVVGDAALCVNPFDIDEIADGIVRLLDDGALRERLRAAGFRRAQQFTWDAAAARLRAVLLRQHA